MLYEVPDEIRTALHNTLFYEIRNITEEEMTAINFGILKVVHQAGAEELHDGEFYQQSSDMQFFAHKYDAENIEFESLVI